MLGISLASQANPTQITAIEDEPGDPSLNGLWQATANLRRFTDPRNAKLWTKEVVSKLWTSFYDNMEGLHFQSEREASKNPTPLLLASILYVSALNHKSKELAALAPEYFRATCSAIAELSIPPALKRSGQSAISIEGDSPQPTAEQNAFQNVLGLILAGLISEAFIDLTGIWISIGYRLTLDHCPVWIDESSNKWRQLFSGLQVGWSVPYSLHLLIGSRSLTSNTLHSTYHVQLFPSRHLYLHSVNCRALRKIPSTGLLK